MRKLLIILSILLFINPACNPDRSSKLSVKEVNNLISFARLFGYVRYFYPGDMASRINWDKFAVYGVREILNIKDDKELAQTLTELFKPIAPLLEISNENIKNNIDSITYISAIDTANMNHDIICWKHHGVGLGNESKWKWYYSKRASTLNDTNHDFKSVKYYPNPNYKYKFNLGSDLTCYFPLSMHTINGKTFPEENLDDFNILNKKIDECCENDSLINKKYIQLTDVIIYWNIIQHFYSNHEYTSANWNDILSESIVSGYASLNETEFIKTLEKMTAYLNDGHGQIHNSGIEIDDVYGPQVDLQWNNDTLFVISVDDEVAAKISKGDYVTSVDGLPVKEALANQEKYVSGSRVEWKRVKYNKCNSVLRLLRGNKDTFINIDLTKRVNNEKYKVKLIRNKIIGFAFGNNRATYKEVEPGIFYINAGYINIKQFENLLPKLVNTKGIILDLREYPTNIWIEDILSHMIVRELLSQKMLIPVVLYPDRINMTYDTVQNKFMPEKPFIRSRIVFITAPSAISTVEYFLSIVKYYKLGPIVGQVTSGTNGGINPFTLPGGYEVVWTGCKVINQDDSQFVGIGVQPDIKVTRTINGIINGKDEILEEALKVLKR